jgi:hypothetical protein
MNLNARVVLVAYMPSRLASLLDLPKSVQKETKCRWWGHEQFHHEMVELHQTHWKQGPFVY